MYICSIYISYFEGKSFGVKVGGSDYPELKEDRITEISGSVHIKEKIWLLGLPKFSYR